MISNKDGDCILAAHGVDLVHASTGSWVATRLRKRENIGVVEVQPICDIVDTTAIKLRGERG